MELLYLHPMCKIANTKIEYNDHAVWKLYQSKWFQMLGYSKNITMQSVFHTECTCEKISF